MNGLPDPNQSRAVLIGTSQYEKMVSLPAVRNNILQFAKLLVDGRIWGLPKEHCVTIRDPSSREKLLDSVVEAATEAKDTLLFYYAGHGLLAQRTADLRLALVGSDPDPRSSNYTTVPYDDIRNALLDSQAIRKIVILDCCFSGRALGQMTDDVAAVANVASVDGTYVIASAAENKIALAPPQEEFTAFTGQLLDALRQGIPGRGELLDLDTIYGWAHEAMIAKGRPAPQRRVRNTAGQLSLVRNRAYRPVPAPETSSELPTSDIRLADAPRSLRTARDAPRTLPVVQPAPAALTRPIRILTSDLRDVRCVAFSPDGRLLATGAYGPPADETWATKLVNGYYYEVRLWDPATGQSLRTFKSSKRKGGPVSAVAFSPDGHLLAVAVCGVFPKKDPQVLLWDTLTGQHLWTFEWDIQLGASPSLLFSPDGSLVITGTSKGAIGLWNPVTGQHLRTLEVGKVHTVNLVPAFSPDGRLLAVGDRTVQLWDPATGQHLRTLEPADAGTRVSEPAFSPDGRLLAAVVTQYSTTGSTLTSRDRVNVAVGESLFGKPLPTPVRDRVPVWDPVTGQHLRTMEPGDIGTDVSALAFSPDGRLLAAGTKHDGVWLWNPATGKLKGTLEAGENGIHVSALAFSPGGHLLAVGGGRLLQLWRQ